MCELQGCDLPTVTSMKKAVELHALDDEVLDHRRKSSVPSKPASDFDRDRYELARAGKQQVLKRRFGLVSMTGLSCGLMCTWETLLVLFNTGFTNGGPAGLIYGFIFVWLGNISVFMVIGELSSAIPTAGGQYHWVSLLAPRPARKFFSYLTGWLTVIGWVAALTATSYFVVDLTLQLVQMNHDDYVRESFHGTLLTWASLLICVVINIFISGALPSIEVVILIIHIIGFFGILIPLVYLAPLHNTADTIFTTFRNDGDWSTKALAFFVGLQGNALAFVGTDSAVHMSEEVKNATTDVARSMIISLLINGCLALGMLFAILFSTPAIIDPPQGGFSFIYIFKDAVGSKAGASIMTGTIIVLEFCSALGCLAAASRMTWSFARDRGLPFSQYLSMIDRRTTIPIVAIILVTICAALLALINIGSNVAFNGTISVVLEGFYISYFLAISLLFWRRVRGDMGDTTNSTLTRFDSTSPSDTSEHHLSWGPWRLRGKLGVVNNAVACCYLLLLIFFSFWPNGSVVGSGAGMNWAVLVTGVVMIFSVVYYVFYARKKYNGPIVEVDPHTL